MNKFNVCASSELDIFHRPSIQTSITNSKYVNYNPTTDIAKGNNPIEFMITGTKGEYIDISDTYLYLRVAIVKHTQNGDGNIIKEEDEIGPINYLLHTIFKQVDIDIGTTSYPTTNNYGYRSLIEALLNYGYESKATHLDSALWSKDDAGQMDLIVFKDPTHVIAEVTPSSSSSSSTEVKTKRNIDNLYDHLFGSKRVKRELPDGLNGRNIGLIKRRKSFVGQSCELFGRVHLDICNSDQFLVDGLNIKLKFTKNNDLFSLMGKEGYDLIIKESVLYVNKAVLSNEVLVAHALVLEKKNAFYPINRVDCQYKTISAKSSSATFESLYASQLPKRLVLGMVESTAFNGNLSKNPFNFQHFGITNISLTLEGSAVSHSPYVFNFDNKNPKFLTGYYSLFNTNESVHKVGNDISIGDYQSGYFLVAFDLSVDKCSTGTHYSLPKTGNLRLELTFGVALEQSLCLIMYAEFENYLEITKNKDVLLNFSMTV